MSESELKLSIEAFKKQTGHDVTVTLHYFTGSWYENSPLRWYGATSLFRVGPFHDPDEAISELARLHAIRKA